MSVDIMAVASLCTCRSSYSARPNTLPLPCPLPCQSLRVVMTDCVGVTPETRSGNTLLRDDHRTWSGKALECVCAKSYNPTTGTTFLEIVRSLIWVLKVIEHNMINKAVKWDNIES